MSILIKNLKMPKGENIMLLIEPDGKVWKMGDLMGNDTLLDGVKAEELPPHGRLIDADVLYESCALDTNIDVMASAKRINEYMQLKIDEAPTIIPANVPDNNVGNIPAEEGE